MKKKNEFTNQASKRVYFKILKHLANQETVLSNFLMIVLQLHLLLNLIELTEKNLKN